MCIAVCLRLQRQLFSLLICFVSWDADFIGQINPDPLPLAWTGLANRKHSGEIKVWEERQVKVFILPAPFLLDPGVTLAVFPYLRPQPSTGSVTASLNLCSFLLLLSLVCFLILCWFPLILPTNL